MPGVLQIEAMAQAACLCYIREGDADHDFFIASVQEAKSAAWWSPATR